MADDPRRDDNDPDEEGRRDESNPLEDLFRQLGMPTGPGQGGQPDLNALMQQLQQAFGQMFTAGSQGPTPGYAGFANPGASASAPQPGQVDWGQVSTLARKVCAEQGADPAPTTAQRDQVNEATRIAESWLDPATVFPGTEEAPRVWTRSEWITSTLPVWKRTVSPVASSLADALAEALLSDGEGGQPPELAGLGQMMKPMLRASAAMMYGTKVGEALGRVASEVLGVTDIGLPLSDSSAVVLLPTNVQALTEGLDQSATDVAVYLALRESARQRLFSAAPWLRPQLQALFEQYAAGIRIDTSALEEMYRDMDPAQLGMESMLEKFEEVQGRLFEPARTDSQQVVLQRIESLLALIEGWVDDVVTQAAAPWMPAAVALAETIRRRRATGGPAEEALASLIGLELRPRRMRDATNLWAAIRDAHGMEQRDKLWDHPDTVPPAEALDDPIGYVRGELGGPDDGRLSDAVPDDMDAELEKLLTAADEERDNGDSQH